MLEGLFDEIVRTFTPQQVDYSNTAYGKDHWQLSCFMEYCTPPHHATLPAAHPTLPSHPTLS